MILLLVRRTDRMSNSSAISTTTHSWSCKTRIRCMVGIPHEFPLYSSSSPLNRFYCVTLWIRSYHPYSMENSKRLFFRALRFSPNGNLHVFQNLSKRIPDWFHQTTPWPSSPMMAVNRIIVATVRITMPDSTQTGKLILQLVWSNFEIGNLDLWRGEAYSKFFDFLDEKGGFYYEVNGLNCWFNLRCWKCGLALGRCSCPQHWSCFVCEKGSNRRIICPVTPSSTAKIPLLALFQRHWISAWAIPALSTRRSTQKRQMLVW